MHNYEQNCHGNKNGKCTKSLSRIKLFLSTVKKKKQGGAATKMSHIFVYCFCHFLQCKLITFRNILLLVKVCALPS